MFIVCVYIYIYFEECIFRQQIIIQASFVKDDGTLVVYYFFKTSCYFSSVGI